MAARPLALVLIAASCLACSSGPEPEPSERSAPLQSADETPPTPAEPQPEETPSAPSDGAVSFNVTDADLAAEVLPLFYQQARVLVVWRGEPRSVSLSINSPLPWKTALQLVCRFTKTVARFDAPDRVTLLDELDAQKSASSSGPAGFDSLPSSESGTRGRRPTPIRNNDPTARRRPTPTAPSYRQSQDRSMDRVRASAYRKPPQGY